MVHTSRLLLGGFLILSPVVFWYHLLEPFESCKAALTQLVALVFLGVGVTVAQRRTWTWIYEQTRSLFTGPIGGALLFSLFAAIVSTLFSLSPRMSLQGAMDSYAGLGSVLALTVIFATTRAVCTDAPSMFRVLHATFGGIAIASGYALVQALGFDPLRWADVSGYREWTRPCGTQGHPNYLAGHAVMVLPILLYFVQHAIQQRLWVRSVVGGILTSLCGLAIVFSLSRAAWLAAFVVIVVLLIGKRWRPSFQQVSLLAVTCFVVYLPLGEELKSALWARVESLASSPGRGPIWTAAWDIFLAHPWTGSGLDTFGLTFPNVRTPAYWDVEWGMMPMRAHNDLFQTLATQGIVGAMAYLAMPIALGVCALRAWKREEQRSLVVLLVSIASAFYVQNVFGFAVASTSALLAIVAGMLARLASRGRESPVETSNRRLTPPARLAYVACLAPLAIAAWFLLTPLVASSYSHLGDDYRATQLAPGHDIFHVRHANALLTSAGRERDTTRRQELLRTAHASIDQAITLQPRSANNHAHRGRILFEVARQGLAEPKEALSAFERALTLDPCDYITLADAARAATTFGAYADSERYLTRALREQPHLGMLQAERAALEYARGEYDKAEVSLREAVTKEWHGDMERMDRALLLLGMVLLQRGKVLDAHAQINEIIRRHPDWLPARWLRAFVMEQRGWRQKALAEYREVLARQPDHAHAQAGVSRLTGTEPRTK
jgi:O-antigen ligase/Tfp pilus assembly protein PilF